MSSLYSRSALSPFTRANSEQVNAELAKVQAAIDTLTQRQDDIVAGTPIASYTWIAYADSLDGTANFTTGEANGRLFIGLAYNRGSPTESTDPTDYSWTRLRGEDGVDAGSGLDGLSIVEKFVYKRSATTPSTPTGGAFNFSTQATTAPSGWSTNVPSGTDPVWISVAVAAKQGTGGSASFGTWSAPVLAFTNGDAGSDGVDGAPGSAVDIIFKRSATQPATPAPGMSTPAGWYTNVAAVPGGSNPMWSSFGTRPDPASNWTWNVPVRVEGVDGTDGLPGVDGADGTTHYTWIAYADAPDGTFNFTTGAPNGRVYQGIAANKTTPTESTNPADYTWSQYVGPPNFGLAVKANAVLAGNKLISTSAVAGWNGSVHSTESFKGGASVSFIVDQLGLFMVGLNTDPTSDANYYSIDFAIYIAGTTTVQVYESGSAVHDIGAPASVGDVFTVTYTGKAVTYSRNGVVFYTNSAPGANLTLFIDTSFNSGSTYFGRILSFTAVGQPGLDGADGADGADGRDAITYVQDTTPSGSHVVNDTWYAPTSKVWKRWDGSNWVQIMGNVASLDVITGTYISANTIVASKFLTDQGVDLAAIVNGSLNTAVTATQGSAINLPVTTNSPNTNDAAVVTTADITINSTGDSVFVNGSVVVTALSNRAALMLQVSVNAGGWTDVQEISSTSNQGVPVGTYTFSTEYLNPSVGTLAFRIWADQNAAQSLGDGTAGTNWTITSGSIRVRRFFSK